MSSGVVFQAYPPEVRSLRKQRESPLASRSSASSASRWSFVYGTLAAQNKVCLVLLSSAVILRLEYASQRTAGKFHCTNVKQGAYWHLFMQFCLKIQNESIHFWTFLSSHTHCVLISQMSEYYQHSNSNVHVKSHFIPLTPSWKGLKFNSVFLWTPNF